MIFVKLAGIDSMMTPLTFPVTACIDLIDEQIGSFWHLLYCFLDIPQRNLHHILRWNIRADSFFHLIKKGYSSDKKTKFLSALLKEFWASMFFTTSSYSLPPLEAFRCSRLVLLPIIPQMPYHQPRLSVCWSPAISRRHYLDKLLVADKMCDGRRFYCLPRLRNEILFAYWTSYP